MVYETFLRTINQWMQSQLGDHYRVSVKPVMKNNGVSLDGLCISNEDTPLSPTIYLNSYFEKLQNGMSMEEIQEQLWCHYSERKEHPHVNPRLLSSFPQIREQIAFKLIYREANKELLSRVPHKPFLDLAIVYYMILSQSENEQFSSLIYHDQLNRWNITPEELYFLAHANTPLLLPSVLEPMNHLLKSIAKDNLGDQYDEEYIDQLLSTENMQSPLYVLSNINGVMGASSILYPHVLQNFAQEKGQDLVILPSSIHEVLLLPYEDDMNYDELNEMITAINLTEVPKEDRLSNHIYLYERNSDTITIPASFSALGEIVSPQQKWPLQ